MDIAYQFRLPGDGTIFTPHLLPDGRHHEALHGRTLARAVIKRAVMDLAGPCGPADKASALTLLTTPSDPWWTLAGLACPPWTRVQLLLQGQIPLTQQGLAAQPVEALDDLD